MATIQQILAYLNQYKARYPLPTLKAQLVKQNVPPEMIDQAIKMLAGAAPAQPPPAHQPQQPAVRPQANAAQPQQPAARSQPPTAQPQQPAAQPAAGGGAFSRHPGAPKPTAAPVVPSSKRSFILVVDDDELIRDMIVSKLEGAGYRVTSATDAAESVIQAEGMKLSLIVSDIEMPGFGSGVDALKKLRASSMIPKNLPVVFVTGMPPKEAQKIVPKNDPYIRLMHKPVDWKLLETFIYDMTLQDKPLT